MGDGEGVGHVWRFFRAGGFNQVRLDSGADLAALDQLDQKLWSALACPTSGLEFDSRTLALLDADGDGRIRVPEVLSATRWMTGCLKDPDQLLKGGDALPLAAVDDSKEEGKRLISSARQILAGLGKKDATAVCVADVTDTAKIFSETSFNGDGVVPADAGGDDFIKAAIKDIIGCVGAETDRSGKPGIDKEKTDLFFKEAEAFSEWHGSAEGDKAVLPLGGATESAYSAFARVKAKVDDYFARCRLAAFDPRAINALNREEKEYLAMAAKDLTITSAEIAALPLAAIQAGRPLPFNDSLNPAWVGDMDKLMKEAVEPLFGARTSITEADWTKLTAIFSPYEAWLGKKTGAAVEKLGIVRVREMISAGVKEIVDGLIEKDLSLRSEFESIAAVEKLVRFNRDLYRLLCNFVSFRDFYGRKGKAVFQAGTLFLDTRSCDLCIRVEDVGKHAMMAGLSRTYLAYCECVRKGSGEKMTIAAAFTEGDSDDLILGRNGVFYDRQGRDWDATIVKIIENPISIRQAFWAPYKRVVRFTEEQVAKRAAAGESGGTEKLKGLATGGVKPAELKPKFDVGVVAALGVAVGGITAALGAIMQSFFGLGLWMPLGVMALILMISGSSMMVAWLKLRQRNLGPLLDANGWAVNAKAKINIPFGASLTSGAVLPPGAVCDLTDPYAEKKPRWKLWTAIVLVLIIALSWWQGRLDDYLPNVARSTSVLGRHAPAFKAQSPAAATEKPAPPGK